jgi:hypothetical protein
LGVAEGPSSLGEQCGEGEVELDVLDVFVGELEEIFGRSEFPALGFEAATFGLIHRGHLAAKPNERLIRHPGRILLRQI